MIIFYSMDNCGHCINAKNALKKYIDEKFIIVKHSDNAPADVRSFPHFVSDVTNHSCSGFSNTQKLFEKLGYVLSK